MAVVDANAVIKGGQSLTNLADKLVTVYQVLTEIRDPDSRPVDKLARATYEKLEHRVDDLENRLDQQDIKSSGSTHGASKESPKTPEHKAKMKEKQKGTESGSTHGSTSKDGQGVAKETETEKQQDSQTLEALVHGTKNLRDVPPPIQT